MSKELCVSFTRLIPSFFYLEWIHSILINLSSLQQVLSHYPYWIHTFRGTILTGPSFSNPFSSAHAVFLLIQTLLRPTLLCAHFPPALESRVLCKVGFNNMGCSLALSSISVWGTHDYDKCSEKHLEKSRWKPVPVETHKYFIRLWTRLLLINI